MNNQNLISGVPGSRVTLSPDWFVLTDGTDPVPAPLQGRAVKDSSRVKVFIDHETPCGTEVHAAVQKTLIQFARETGCELFNGYGTSYAIMLRRFVKEGDVVAVSGEFGSIYGMSNAVAIKLSPEEMAEALVSGTITVTVPLVQHLQLTGSLKAPACGKDAALRLLPQLTPGTALAVSGEGFASLPAPEQTAFLQLLGAAGISCTCLESNCIAPDLSLELSEVVPMVAGPDSPLSAVPVTELAGKKVTAVFVGGCSAGRIEDIRLIAAMVKGRRVNRYVRTMVAFADTETYIQAANEGLIATLMDAGILVMNQGCSACYARSQGLVDGSDTVLSAGSRICPNCYGEGNAPTYLCSAATAISGALNGAITPVEA